MSNKLLLASERCKYLKPSFWAEHQPWESNPLLSEKSKDYYRRWLAKIIKNEKSLTNVQK